jgi:hypothetical protein
LVSPSSLFELRRARFALLSRVAAPRAANGEAWWSQTGSNRRPHACKARALPAELWPHFLRRRPSSPFGLCRARFALLISRGCATRSQRRSVVGLGRLELPTSRLSSARSNQLSYKPLTTGSVARAHRLAPDASHKRKPLARVRPRRKRNEDGEIPPMELNNPEIVGPLMFLKRSDR